MLVGWVGVHSQVYRAYTGGQPSWTNWILNCQLHKLYNNESQTVFMSPWNEKWKRLIRLFQIWNRTCYVSVTVTALSFRHSHNPVTLMELQSSTASRYCAGDLTTLTVHTVNNAWGYVFIFLTLAAIFLGLHWYLEMCHPFMLQVQIHAQKINK